MNVRVMFFTAFFTFIVAIIDSSLFTNADLNYSGTADYDKDNYKTFTDFLKSFVFPGIVADSIASISPALKYLFYSIYYFSLAYTVVMFIVKILPFVGEG